MAFGYDWAGWGARVQALFPKPWAGGSAWTINGTPATNGRLGAVVYGLTGGVRTTPSGLPFIWTQIQYAKSQMRMATITDTNVDQVGLDWFGGVVPRVPGESDRAYASRLVLVQTAGCPSFPGLTKILQAYLSAWLTNGGQGIPFAADTSGAVDVDGALDYNARGGAVSSTPIAVDNSGALDNSGYLDQASSETALGGPVVYIFDLQSDPVAAAVMNLSWPQFCVALLYPGVSENLLVPSVSVSNLFSTMVKAFKMPGTIPIYASNGPS